MGKTALLAAVICISAASVRGQIAAANPFEGSAAASAPDGQGPVDKLVFARLGRLGIKPANVCSDAVFLRRVYLDVIGTLPTAKEARDFLQDTSPGKRGALIDRLLGRPEFADYWAMKWSDLLRVKAEFPINLWPNAAEIYHRWIRAGIKQNKPYDRFVRELLTASGSNFAVPEVNFYRAVQSKDPNALAKAVALTFMGCRIEKWPRDRQEGLAEFFSRVGYKCTAEWKEEIVFFDPGKAGPAGGAARPVMLPDGTKVQLAPDRDGREVFADWLISPKNQWFARNIVNRAWCWLVGRGIIHEPDDIRPDNPPNNPELLDLLQRELVAARWDVKAVFRLILNSRTYQLSSIPASDNPRAEAEFACYGLRRLEAEVLIDALCQITGTTEKYTSAIPEPFTFIPERQRSIALADGSITSSFLEMYGRPARDTGLESERNNRPTPSQRLHLINSSHIQRKIEQGWKIQALLRSKASPRETVTIVYLTILSRLPTAEELKIVGDYSTSSSAKGRDAVVDLVWSLVNSTEFLYRH
jgi:hypothetical protein